VRISAEHDKKLRCGSVRIAQLSRRSNPLTPALSPEGARVARSRTFVCNGQSRDRKHDHSLGGVKDEVSNQARDGVGAGAQPAGCGLP
jgi:hypothetical protein